MTIQEPVPFEELAAKAPKHSPEACERASCGRCRPQGKPQAPEIGRNPHDAAAAPPPPDAVVRSIGLPRHPDPREMQVALRTMADTLNDRVLMMAHLLAMRGYAATTLGDGGSRGTDGQSSTERNGERYMGGFDEDTGEPIAIPSDVKWLEADVKLAGMLRDVTRSVTRATAFVAKVMHHAADMDEVPAGTGYCGACGRFCRPSKDKPGNRISKGFCPTCYRAWARADRPNRSDWIHHRRRFLTDDHGVLHTPEPDHDLDLSREIPA